MVQPGSIGSIMPPSEDSQLRRVADLERFVRELGPSVAASFASTVADLQAQQAELAAQTAYQAGLITRSASVGSYDSGAIPGDQVYRYVNGTPSITLSVPTGRVLVTVGCEVARLDPGTIAAEGKITFNITEDGASAPWYPSGVSNATIYSVGENNIGLGVSAVVPVTVNAGVSTFTAAFGTWSASPSAKLIVSSPYIVVQVIDAL